MYAHGLTRRHLALLSILVVCAWFAADRAVGVNNSLAGYIWLTAVFACLAYQRTHPHALELVGAISVFLLYVIPYFANFLLALRVNYDFYALVLMLYAAILLFVPSPIVSRRQGPGSAGWVLLWIASATAAQWLGHAAFTFVFAVSLLVFEDFCRTHTKSRNVLWLLALYVTSVALYSVYAWSGYGRLVLGTFLIIPFVIASYYRHVRIRPILLYPALLLATAIAIISRVGQFDGAASITGGSGAHHLEIMSELAEQKAIPHYGSIWDQFMLLLFNWMPRALWPDKPLGLGYSFVDDYIGRVAFGEDHSVSLGIFGEHLFLNRDYWVASFLLLLVALALLRMIIRRLASPNVSPLIAFDVSLISLLWGGMATFGSRAWFLVIPMIASIYIVRTIRSLSLRLTSRDTRVIG